MKYYYENQALNSTTTKIIKAFEENGKNYAMLEDSLFYPQGGGQKGDRGTLEINGEIFQVLTTVKDENYNSIVVLDKLPETNVIANCTLNREFRDIQRRLHTSLHLIHAAIEYVKGSELEYPTLSLIDENFAVNKYKDTAFEMEIIDKAIEQFNLWINEDHEVITYADDTNENYRYWKCMNVIIPCGGIHVNHLSEIGNVKISVSHKKKAYSVRIDLE